MAAYMIFIREGAVTDEAAMDAYRGASRSGPPPAGMKPLVVYGAMECLEGEAADGVVVLEFPDSEAARAWYHSPEYQERAALRQKAAPFRCLLVEGI